MYKFCDICFCFVLSLLVRVCAIVCGRRRCDLFDDLQVEMYNRVIF
jgi:hypothetical protein